MLELPDVTLVSVHTVSHDLSMMAVRECLKHVKFGDLKIFSDRASEFATIPVPKFANLIEAGRFTVYELPDHIKTSHALFIHYDSWVLDPGMWTDEFLKYDYIGAPWWRFDEYNVGNSGFCLRSKALMDFLAANEEKFPIVPPEDDTLCRVYQPLLPQFKWAPQALAERFAFERLRPAIDSRQFGYHGVFNWPFILSYDEFNERMEMVRQDPYLQKSGAVAELDAIWYGIWGHLTKRPKIYKGV